MISPRRVGLAGHPGSVYPRAGPGCGASAEPKTMDDDRIRAATSRRHGLGERLILDA